MNIPNTNIPKPRADGWTPSYLEELRKMADSLIPHIDTIILRDLSMSEWRKMLDATENERKIFTYYAAEWYGASSVSPDAWLNHRVAERCYDAAQVRVARRIVASRRWGRLGQNVHYARCKLLWGIFSEEIE